MHRLLCYITPLSHCDSSYTKIFLTAKTVCIKSQEHWLLKITGTGSVISDKY